MEEKLETQATQQDSGYVYVLSNESMPGIVKIGLTTGDVTKRALELQSTGLPTPFKIELALHVPNCRRLERLAHNKFQDSRVKSNREFFAISTQEARDELFRLADGEFTNKELFDVLFETETRDIEAEFETNFTRKREKLDREFLEKSVTRASLGFAGGIVFSLMIAASSGKL